MPNDSISLLNWYRRYRVRAVDMNLQEKSLIDHPSGIAEGLLGGAAVSGFECDAASANFIQVGPGIAVGPTGFLLASTGSEILTLPAQPSAGNSARHLIVARPLLVDGEFIANPTAPLSSVPLITARECQIVAVTGAAGPSALYPFSSLQANDVVLFGVKQYPAALAAPDNIDMLVRDYLGARNHSRAFEAITQADPRCRPYRAGYRTVGVQPSQIADKGRRSFTYILKNVASIFPKTGGVFTNAAAIYNFATGAVSGGDGSSPAFTPTIPSAGNFIVATMSITSGDLMSVSYGIQGTLAQCLDGIQNQRTSGAGAIASIANAYRVALVIVWSPDGVNVGSVDVIDARGSATFGGPDTQKTYPNVFLSSQGAGDTTSLATAVSLLPASGGVILVMDEVVVPTSVVIPSNTKLLGRGKGARLNLYGTSGLLLSDNVIVQDIVLAATGGIVLVAVTGDYGVIETTNFVPPTTGAICVEVFDGAAGLHVGESLFYNVLVPNTSVGIQFDAGSSETTEANNIYLS